MKPLPLVATALLVTVVGPSFAQNPEDAPVEITIATRHAPPFAIQTDEGWDGITLELVRQVAEHGNFTFELVPMGIEEMLHATANGEVAAAAAALTITAEREERVDFTHPFLTSGLGIAVQHRPEVTLKTVLGRFGSGEFARSAGTLLAILAAIGALVWLVERRSNDQFPASPAEGLGAGLWWSAVTMTTVGYGDKAPVTVPGRIIGLVWMFASIIIISGFTASIATSLTVGQLDRQVAGLHDLYTQRVVTAGGSTSAAYLDDKLVRYRTVPTVEDALAELAAGNADAVVYDLPILRYLVREQYVGELDTLTTLLVRQDYGIALPPDRPRREELNQEILRIIQSPEWERLLEGYLGTDG